MNRKRTFVATAIVAVAAMIGAGAAIAAGTTAPPPRTAFVANAYVPADALAAGPAAGRLGAPIFTTPQDSLSTAAEAGLTAYGPDLVVVLGGTAAIAESVVDDIADATGLAKEDIADTPATGIVRVAGVERTETAQKIADLFSSYDPGFLPADGKAYDADLLDGMDSADFVRASDIAGLVPVAVLNINADGSVDAVTWRAPLTGEPVVTQSGVGRYDVDLPGVNYRYDRDAAVCTLNDGDPGEVSLNSIGGDDLRIWTFDSAGASEDRDLNCSIYNVTP